MTVDPLVLMTDVDQATDNLLRTLGDLSPGEVGAPSLLPGWSKGHVLSHLARQADALTNLLTWARTGVETPAYASPEQREKDIEAGSGRPLAAQIADLRDAHERFADAAAAMTGEAWVFFVPGREQPAAALPWARLRELEVHHVDLDAGYTPTDWTDAFALRLLREVVTTPPADGPAMVLRPYATEHALTIGDAAGAPVVAGPTRSLAAWLTGRGDGSDLTVAPDGELPVPAVWM